MGRPKSVLVFGILNIVAAVIGVCGFGMALAMRFDLFKMPTENNPALELMDSNPGYRLFTDVLQILGAVGIIVLLATAIGLLLMKPWARVVAIGYGIYRILMVILGGVVSYVLLLGPMLEQTSGGSGPERMGAVFGVVGLLLGSLISILYWIVQMFFLTRPAVVAAFTDQWPEGTGDVDAAADMPWR